MVQRFHMALSVRGALKNRAYDRELVGCSRHSHTGKLLTPSEIFEELCDYLAAGVELIPMGEKCDNWDPKTGCRGHEQESEAA